MTEIGYKAPNIQLETAAKIGTALAFKQVSI